MAVEAVTSTSELAYLRLRIVAFLVTLGRPRLGYPTGAPSRGRRVLAREVTSRTQLSELWMARRYGRG